jgi:anti-anti-sigma regulatory factor
MNIEFKIDTKDTFCTIIPIADTISAKMTGELGIKCGELRQSGSKNFIVDLQHCAGIDKTAVKELVTLHEESYGRNESLVFTGINKEVMAVLKEDETDLLINITPRMDEAIDIISMEILERDLFGEE